MGLPVIGNRIKHISFSTSFPREKKEVFSYSFFSFSTMSNSYLPQDDQKLGLSDKGLTEVQIDG